MATAPLRHICAGGHGTHAGNTLRLPRARVYRTRSSRAASDRTSSSSSSSSSSSFNAEQLAFLERKRQYKAGLGPAMPPACACPDCNSKGTVICWACKGTGINEQDMAKEVMKAEDMSQVQQRNGVVNVMWFLFKGGPCFICRGRPDVPCLSCEGTGIRDFNLANYTGD